MKSVHNDINDFAVIPDVKTDLHDIFYFYFLKELYEYMIDPSKNILAIQKRQTFKTINQDNDELERLAQKPYYLGNVRFESGFARMNLLGVQYIFYNLYDAKGKLLENECEKLSLMHSYNINKGRMINTLDRVNKISIETGGLQYSLSEKELLVLDAVIFEVITNAEELLDINEIIATLMIGNDEDLASSWNEWFKKDIKEAPYQFFGKLLSTLKDDNKIFIEPINCHFNNELINQVKKQLDLEREILMKSGKIKIAENGNIILSENVHDLIPKASSAGIDAQDTTNQNQNTNSYIDNASNYIVQGLNLLKSIPAKVTSFIPTLTSPSKVNTDIPATPSMPAKRNERKVPDGNIDAQSQNNKENIITVNNLNSSNSNPTILAQNKKPRLSQQQQTNTTQIVRNGAKQRVQVITNNNNQNNSPNSKVAKPQLPKKQTRTKRKETKEERETKKNLTKLAQIKKRLDVTEIDEIKKAKLKSSSNLLISKHFIDNMMRLHNNKKIEKSMPSTAIGTPTNNTNNQTQQDLNNQTQLDLNNQTQQDLNNQTQQDLNNQTQQDLNNQTLVQSKSDEEKKFLITSHIFTPVPASQSADTQPSQTVQHIVNNNSQNNSPISQNIAPQPQTEQAQQQSVVKQSSADSQNNPLADIPQLPQVIPVMPSLRKRLYAGYRKMFADGYESDESLLKAIFGIPGDNHSSLWWGAMPIVAIKNAIKCLSEGLLYSAHESLSYANEHVKNPFGSALLKGSSYFFKGLKAIVRTVTSPITSFNEAKKIDNPILSTLATIGSVAGTVIGTTLITIVSAPIILPSLPFIGPSLLPLLTKMSAPIIAKLGLPSTFTVGKLMLNTALTIGLGTSAILGTGLVAFFSKAANLMTISSDKPKSNTHLLDGVSIEPINLSKKQNIKNNRIKDKKPAVQQGFSFVKENEQQPISKTSFGITSQLLNENTQAKFVSDKEQDSQLNKKPG